MPPNDSTRGEGPGETNSDRTPADRPVEEAPVAGLSELYGDALPTPELEGRVLAGLQAEGLLGSTSDAGRRPGVRWPLRAAAALVLFAAGWGTRGAMDPRVPLPDIRGTEDYMLLVYGDASAAQSLDPAVVAAEYEAWGRGLAEEGVGVTGNELAPDRIVLGEPGPAADGALGGYFLLSAGAGQDVERLVQGHPHLRYGGWIEVAPILRRN